MEPTRLFASVAWVFLPTVMFGGYSLLGLRARANPWLAPARHARFRQAMPMPGLLGLWLVYSGLACGLVVA